MNKKDGYGCFLDFSGCVAVIQPVAGAFAVDDVSNLHDRKSRKVNHGMEHMGENLFGRGECTV